MPYSHEELVNVVSDVLIKVLEGKSHPRPKIERTLNLVTDLALDSLDLAQLVALLELRMGFDPFSTRVAISDIHTVEDLYCAYTCPAEPIQESLTTANAPDGGPRDNVVLNRGGAR